MLSLLRYAVGHNYKLLRVHKRAKLIFKLLYVIRKWIQKRLKYLLSFLFIYHQERTKLMVLFLTFYIIHQVKNERNCKWWSGLMDTSQLALFYLQTFYCLKFTKNVMTAKDGEKYCVWTPPTARATRATRATISLSASCSTLPYPYPYPKIPLIAIAHNNVSEHVWVCLPGGMFDIDPAMIALYTNNVFSGSQIVIFNNPGISSQMRSKALISPTDPQYLIEYLSYLIQHGYRVSLIGFSIGTVFALRTLHSLKNDTCPCDVDVDVDLECVILVHAPDIVREAVISNANNWLFRVDLYFALHIRVLQHTSNSWNMIKHGVNTNAFNGWKFIKQCTEVSLNEEWHKCEDKQFNLRSFCDESIADVPVLRIIAKNDFVIPHKRIDETYFKYLKKVLITERGGHCGVHASKQTMDEIKAWNDRIVNYL